MHTAAAGRWWALFGLWLVYATFGLTVTSLAPLIAPIERDLHITHAAMGSLMGAWQLVYLFAAIPCGVLLDRVGGRWGLLLGAALIAASAAGRALAVDYWTFLVAVMLFGLGGPLVSSGAPKVVADQFSGSARGLAMGIYMTGPAIGGVVSLTLTNSWLLPVLGGDWRSVIWLWSALAGAAGLLWLAISSITGIGRMQSVGPDESTRTGAVRELLAQPAVRVVLLMSVGAFLYNHGLNNWLVELLANHGLSVVDAGYWAALPTLVGIVGSLVIPRLATPRRRFAILAALCVAALVASILLRFADPLPLAIGLVLQGIARSSMMTVLILTLVELPGIGERRVGVASGIFFTAAEVGGVLGPLGMGVLYESTGGFGSRAGHTGRGQSADAGCRRLSAEAGSIGTASRVGCED